MFAYFDYWVWFLFLKESIIQHWIYCLLSRQASRLFRACISMYKIQNSSILREAENCALALWEIGYILPHSSSLSLNSFIWMSGGKIRHLSSCIWKIPAPGRDHHMWIPSEYRHMNPLLGFTGCRLVLQVLWLPEGLSLKISGKNKKVQLRS